MSTQNKLTVCFLALCASGFSQSPALAHKKADWNNVTSLARAAEVRVELSGSRSVRGGVLNITEDSLAVNSASGQETFTREQVLRVSVRKQSRRGRHVLVGFAIGAGVGVALGATTAAVCSGSVCGGYGGDIIGVATGAGAALGATIGALAPASGWHEVYRQ